MKDRSDFVMENGELLKLKILLSLLQCNAEDSTVSGIARTLNREKYAVSRAAAALEKENSISRTDGRKLVLTRKGRDEAAYYAQRLQTCLDHLLYGGVSLESAKQDALLLARYGSDNTMERVRNAESKCRTKYQLRSRHQFSGAVVCRILRDGSYDLPYVIYREHVCGGSNISMANDGFEHPCVLYVKDGVGTVHLHAVTMSRQLPGDDRVVSAKIRNMKYFDNGRFVAAEIYGDLFSFPAEVLNFLNYGNGAGQILHGSACLQIECPMDFGGQTQVIFTMFI